MKSSARSLLAPLSVFVVMAAISVAGAEKPAPVKPGAYDKVDKILHAKCVGCHQGPKAAAGVDLSSYASVMKSKFKGKPIVVAKKVKDSVLANAVTGHGVMKMPPGGALPAPDVKVIEAWIAAGAKK